MVHIPTEEEFITGTTARTPLPGQTTEGQPIFTDFIAAPELQRIAERLIKDGPASHLDDGELKIDYRWKHRGGSHAGKAVMGRCVKLSGPARHYAGGAHFLIWLAADVCEVEGFDARQIEALLFHELLQIEREEKTDKFDNPITVYHKAWMDFDGFYAELREYGAWSRDLQRLEETVRQLPLFDYDEPVDSGIGSITFEANGESATLTRDSLPNIEKALRASRAAG